MIVIITKVVKLPRKHTIIDKEDIIWLYVLMFAINKQSDNSIAILEDYIAKNPTSAQAYQGMCNARLMAKGRVMDTPIEYFYEPCFKCMELDPSMIYGKYYLAELHFMRSEFEESRQFWQELAEVAPIPMFFEGIMRSSYYLGDTATAMQYYDRLMMMAEQGIVSPIVMSRIYSTLDNIDSVAKYLDLAFEVNDIELVALWNEPALDRVRDEPKFQEILKRLQNAGSLAGETNLK
jgi:tetratricopeptide (TPR) repeat protein